MILKKFTVDNKKKSSKQQKIIAESSKSALITLFAARRSTVTATLQPVWKEQYLQAIWRLTIFFFKWSSIHEAPPICMIVAFKFPFLLIFQLWLALQGNYIAAIGIILAFFHGEVNTRVNHENGKMSPYLYMSETEKIIQRFNFSIGTYTYMFFFSNFARIKVCPEVRKIEWPIAQYFGRPNTTCSTVCIVYHSFAFHSLLIGKWL